MLKELYKTFERARDAREYQSQLQQAFRDAREIPLTEKMHTVTAHASKLCAIYAISSLTEAQPDIDELYVRARQMENAPYALSYELWKKHFKYDERLYYKYLFETYTLSSKRTLQFYKALQRNHTPIGRSLQDYTISLQIADYRHVIRTHTPGKKYILEGLWIDGQNLNHHLEHVILGTDSGLLHLPRFTENIHISEAANWLIRIGDSANDSFVALTNKVFPFYIFTPKKPTITREEEYRDHNRQLLFGVVHSL